MSDTVRAPTPLNTRSARPSPRGRTSRWSRSPRFLNALAVAALLGVWQYFAFVNRRIPSIEEVWSFLLIELQGGSHGGVVTGVFWGPLADSLQRYGIGLAIGIPAGAVVGLLMGTSRVCRAVFTDTMLVLLTFPAVIWAFTASLWFGFDSRAPILAVTLTAMPFIAFNLRSGLINLDQGLVEMSDSFRVPRMRRVLHLWMGGAFPSAVTGVRAAFATSWNSLLIVEWFGATSGVGWRARFWYDALRFPGFVAWILVFVALITALDWLVLRKLERRVTYWVHQPTLTFDGVE